MDKVNFEISNKLPENKVLFQYQYEECYKCLNNSLTVDVESNKTLQLLSSWFVKFQVLLNRSNNNEICCSNSLKMDPGVNYHYVIQHRYMANGDISNSSSKINCTIMPDPAAMFDYLLPFYVLLVLLCFCGALYYTVLMLYRHRLFQRLGSKFFLYKIDLIEDFGRPSNVSNVASDDEYDSDITTMLKSLTDRRLKSLDSFRGISIVLMVFVNYGGGGYWFFDYSIWNGVTIADLVFPWFVFVMGVTLSICMFRSVKRSTKKYYWFITWAKGCKRSVILFIIGVALESTSCHGDLNNLRIMGPLQRLAVGYFCLISIVCLVSFLQSKCKVTRALLEEDELLSSMNDINSTTKPSLLCRCCNVCTDIWFCFPYIVISLCLLLAHACITLLMAVPGCPTGYLGPGGIGDEGCCGNCSGGVAGYIDRLIMTSRHMYQTPTSRKLYLANQPFDPEGILGYLSCTALCFLGYWAGDAMLRNKSWLAAVKRLIIYSVFCTVIGIGLCQCKTNGGLIPINKNLWSVSYVMISAGTSFFLLAFLFTTVDVLKLWSGSPFKYPGMNSIVIYCGHILLTNIFPVHWKVNSGYSAKLSMDVWGAVFWTGLGYIMFIKKIFIAI